MGNSGQLAFGKNIRRLREALKLTQENLAVDSGLDRSYIGGIERGERNPSLSTILQLASALNVPPGRLFTGVGEETSTVPDIPGQMTAVETGEGLVIRFRYDRYDARYIMAGATRSQYEDVVNILKIGLTSGRGKSDTVAGTFLSAVRMWPNANPSDLWTFLINRAYCDRSNHPIANERLNLEQSWKRTSGWALERVLVEHYGPVLRRNGIVVKISNKSEKTQLLSSIEDPRIVPDKADVLVTYNFGDSSEKLLGVVHVKASIAERRTDDVPMSQALIEAGYLSIFWTMDSKAFPSPNPVNRGEFGEVDSANISDKRRDLEEHGHFSACFSYNRHTLPTPGDRDVQSRIFVCDFTNPDDHFSRFLNDALRQRLSP